MSTEAVVQVSESVLLSLELDASVSSQQSTNSRPNSVAEQDVQIDLDQYKKNVNHQNMKNLSTMIAG